MLSKTPKAKLTIAAYFPTNYFLENLVLRQDDSALVCAMNHNELWYVPPVGGALPVDPVCIHKYEQPTLGIVETDSDVFYLCTSNLYTTHESYLHRLDLRDWTPEQPLRTEAVFQFPEPVRGLNGACLIGPRILLIADCFAGLIWRVELPEPDSNERPTAQVWLKHSSMDYFPGSMKPEQPGVNGVRFSEKTGYLYYTATAKKLFMRVAVDPDTHDAVGEPEIVVAGRMGDDFCIDEAAGVAYLTTHRQNTIDYVSLEPRDNTGFTQSVAGDPFNETLIGPSSGVWGRAPGNLGHVAYFLSDGGTASPPPDGIVQPAKLLRVEIDG